MMKIRDLFEHDVTRDIPPVVYFHEQRPEKLEAEVGEYIVTGGWPEDHPNHQRVKHGIHEHYVALLRRISEALETSGGPDLPASWISGFYGSGKSSFAKLLGLSLDGAQLPDGTPLSKAWLGRDKTHRRDELVEAWEALQAKIDPIAVVFDIGGVSRGDEHIHTAVLREIQKRLGYCEKSAVVADYELKLERDGHYEAFLTLAENTLDKPWKDLRSTHMVEDHFSAVMHAQFPKLYQDPMDWVSTRDGQTLASLSAEDTAKAIADMLAHRAPGKTLFIVIDEVSQYIYQDGKRMLALQSLVNALGQRLRGKAWLLATGQQKLDDQNDSNILGKMKDRFPAALRVHLDATNIRDVVHRRILQKKREHESTLRDLFSKHRSNLKLFAYGCEDLTEDEFVEVYPMLPRHHDLILRITSALRTRSSRAQGDDHAIRGLLQMLGELFRSQGIAEAKLGTLITIDQVYEVQGSALEVDAQNSMARILEFCSNHKNPCARRCAKAVALLELLQAEDGGEATDSKLVARCLYSNIEDGDNEPAVREALELLRAKNLLGYSAKTGYKIQSSAGQEWERERQDISVPSEALANTVKESLQLLMGDADRPQLQGRGFPWRAFFSTENTHHDDQVLGSRDDAPLTVDLRMLPSDSQDLATWINRSDEDNFKDRMLWIAGAYQSVMDRSRTLGKSERMVNRYLAKRASLTNERRRLLLEEETRLEGLTEDFKKVVADAFMAGTLYFRGADVDPTVYASTFISALVKAGTTHLPALYSQFVPTNVTPGELEQLVQPQLAGPARKFFSEDLGILEQEDGRIVAACAGIVPKRVLEQVEREQGISGQALLRHFGEPPYGYPAAVIKACIAGLLRAQKIRIEFVDHKQATSIADPGISDFFKKDRDFKGAEIYPAGEARIKAKDRYRIADLFQTVFDLKIEPDNEVIADALPDLVLAKQTMLTTVERRLNRLPGHPEVPAILNKLHRAFEDCLRSRQIEAMVLAVVKHLDTLRDGVGRLNAVHSELTDEVINDVRRAKKIFDVQLPQIITIGEQTAALQDAERRIADQLRSDRAWADIRDLDDDLDAVLARYRELRLAQIGKQETIAEEARARIKAVPGFEKLNSDQRHAVLRPVTEHLVETTEGEVEPSLDAIVRGLEERIDRTVQGATKRIDALTSENTGEIIVPVDLELRNRVLSSESDVHALIDEIRERLLSQINREGPRVRVRLH